MVVGGASGERGDEPQVGDTKAFPRKKHGRMWKGAHNVTAGKGGAKRPFISVHENQGGDIPDEN